ncbi:hypothetical protein QFC19_000166 [Naganishia cerealis]|uniref:Uncharacterized protein n=1 Tax=Naganishia cerealis TaxID=610337 RepID=A0ACC2WS17_9TREE|nr:hypothetical protein QFC19_000166 [Naganishia cerealis]
MQEVDCRWIWALSLQHMEVTAAGARIPTLNGILPAEPLPTTGPGYPHTKQVYVDQFVYSLSESVRLRVCNIPPPKVKGFLPLDEPIDLLNVAFENPRTIASAKLERQKAAERAMKIQKMNKRSKGTQQPRAILPLEPVATDGIISSLDSSNSEPPIDETQDIYDVPDRITGRETVAELRKIHPERDWRFVEINITYQVRTTHPPPRYQPY